ncbi:MAG: isoprenylcysteine carboxylmethyltransferase family protein [Ignavibacteria bacterium]|nr:isoprenylcysteine carboxylmethyltransferase family protein [Ignavibacteria bacterium]
MDAINILLAINLLSTFVMGVSVAKQGLKQKLSKVKEKPASFLQSYPPNLAAVLILIFIISFFGIGVFNSDSTFLQNMFSRNKVDNDNFILNLRSIGLLIYIIASWLQIKSIKDMGKFYSQDVLVLNDHSIISSGLFKYIRHPQYLFQILMDLGAGIALLSWIIIPLVVLVEFPLLILRARMEEKLLLKYFPEEYSPYKKKTGFFIPFIG